MPCIKIESPGMCGFICTRGRREIKPCSGCGKPSAILCDYPLGDGKTCDKPLCKSCAVKIGMDTDICPDHDKQKAIDVIFNGGAHHNV